MKKIKTKRKTTRRNEEKREEGWGGEETSWIRRGRKGGKGRMVAIRQHMKNI